MDDKHLKTEFYAKTAKAPETPDMAKINAQSLRELSAEEVFTFKVAACNTLVDRDFEHFTEDCLIEMAEKYVGRTMLVDHEWKSENQHARIYDAYLEDIEGGKQLVLLAYILKTEESRSMIDRIEAGILREVSVGCAVREAVCDLCGNPYVSGTCAHRKGVEYDGRVCTVALSGCADVYEVSFVAVPAQPAAGVTKALEEALGEKPDAAPGTADAQRREIELEAERFRFTRSAPPHPMGCGRPVINKSF